MRIITFFFIVFFQIAIAQENTSEIHKDLHSFIQSQNDKDFDKTVSYLPMEVFEIVTRNQLILEMEQSFNNPQIDVKLDSPRVHKIDSIGLIDNKYYSTITYSFNTKVKFLNAKREFKEYSSEQMDLILDELKEEHGSENVSYNEESKYLKIYSVHKAYAISLDGKLDWKFLTLEENQKPFYEKVLPQELIPN